MPPLPSPGNVINAKMHWRLAGDLLAMTNHFFSYSGGPPSATDVTAMADAFVSHASSNFATLMPTVWGADSCQVTDLASSTGAQATDGAPWLGTASGAALAPSTCTLVNHSINRRYRGGKPRSYMPLGTAADIASAGIWSGAHISAAEAAFNDWVAGMIGSAFGTTTLDELVNVSYYDGFTSVQNPITKRWRNVPTLRTTPQVSAVLASTVAQLIASQRRRNRDA